MHGTGIAGQAALGPNFFICCCCKSFSWSHYLLRSPLCHSIEITTSWKHLEATCFTRGWLMEQSFSSLCRQTTHVFTEHLSCTPPPHHFALYFKVLVVRGKKTHLVLSFCEKLILVLLQHGKIGYMASTGCSLWHSIYRAVRRSSLLKHTGWGHLQLILRWRVDSSGINSTSSPVSGWQKPRRAWLETLGYGRTRICVWWLPEVKAPTPSSCCWHCLL